MNVKITEDIDLQQLVKTKESVSLDLFKEIQSEFWYLTRLYSRQNKTGRSEGRSITPEAKTLSKKYSKELLQEVIDIVDPSKPSHLDNHEKATLQDFKIAVERVVKVHEDNQLKIDTANHANQLSLILVPVFQKCEAIVRDRFKDTRTALTRSFDNCKERADRLKIPTFKNSLYSGSDKLVFNANDIYPLLRKEAADVFGCDWNQDRFFSIAERRNQEAAQRFVTDLANCFRFGLTATLDKLESDHLEAQIAKLTSNLVKYIPIGTDDIQIQPGAKGFEINASLFSKGEMTNVISTNAHAAGGWNVQSFHYRYKTKIQKV